MIKKGNNKSLELFLYFILFLFLLFFLSTILEQVEELYVGKDDYSMYAKLKKNCGGISSRRHICKNELYDLDISDKNKMFLYYTNVFGGIFILVISSLCISGFIRSRQ